MTGTLASGTTVRASSGALEWLAVLSGVAVFLVMQGVAWRLAGGFEYPLDDVYIHLAMAEGIAAGGYGFNPGEAASASSSFLYPYLLAIAPGTGFQRMLPLAWNIAGLALLCWLWGRTLRTAGIGGRAGLAAAVLGPVALNMPGVAFVGMEHTLHAGATLAIVLGLWRFLTDGRVSWWFIAALALAPLLRLEALALGLLAAAVPLLRGRLAASALLAAATLLPVAAFAYYLTTLGLDPVPGPVSMKVGLVAPDAGRLERIVTTLALNLITPQGIFVALLVLTVTGLRLAVPALRQPPASILMLVVGLAGIAHMLFGQIGWMHRYEHYLVVTCAAALTLAQAQVSSRVLTGAWSLAIAAAGAMYLPKALDDHLWHPRAIHLQHAQMARFAHEVLPWPVAVNDLGWVSWRNDNYVLDLWGLGSAESRAIRLGDPQPGWAGPLAQAHGIRMAMIYDKWFAEAVPPEWTRLATLYTRNPHGYLGDWTVSFYVTSPADAPEMLAALRAFAETTPPDAEVTIQEGAP